MERVLCTSAGGRIDSELNKRKYLFLRLGVEEAGFLVEISERGIIILVRIISLDGYRSCSIGFMTFLA